MVALKIADLKQFTAGLFVGNLFDNWLMREAVITVFNTFTIDGHIRRGYYTEEELEENKIEELSSWKVLRPICFSLIKGRKLPESFRITLQLSPSDVETFLNYAQLEWSAEQVSGLYLSIRYEEHIIYCVTGISLNLFTLDRQIDIEWDEAVRLFFKKQKIPFTEE